MCGAVRSASLFVIRGTEVAVVFVFFVVETLARMLRMGCWILFVNFLELFHVEQLSMKCKTESVKPRKGIGIGIRSFAEYFHQHWSQCSVNYFRVLQIAPDNFLQLCN